MEFLPYHYLLTTIGEFGELRYTELLYDCEVLTLNFFCVSYLDVSTGLVPAAHKTKKGPCNTMWYVDRTRCFQPAYYVYSAAKTRLLQLLCSDILKEVCLFGRPT